MMRQQITYLALTLSLALTLALASPALALSPPIVSCGNDDGTGATLIHNYPEDDPEMSGMTFFDVTGPGYNGDTRTTVIVHCATGQTTTWRINQGDYDTNDAIYALIEDNPKLTLRTIARKIDKMDGADASFGRLPAGHCACRPDTHLY